MTNEEITQIKNQIHNLIREWNQAEEFHMVRVADSLMAQIQELQAKVDEAEG